MSVPADSLCLPATKAAPASAPAPTNPAPGTAAPAGEPAANHGFSGWPAARCAATTHRAGRALPPLRRTAGPPPRAAARTGE